MSIKPTRIGQQAAIDAVRVILGHVEPDPSRPGLEETPERFIRALEEYTSGYHADPGAILKVFEDGAEGADEMITVGPIPFFSLCEHHMAPFFGNVWVSYIPNGRIVGLSKIPRLVEVFARRLQVQERMTNEIADAMAEYLDCNGVGVMVKARHMCMESRGVRCAGAKTTTTALRGSIYNDVAARAEFLAAVGGD